ncbi:hypothetical protein BDV10DRAFT_17407 [Aspergillus recurvatus]
MIGTRVLRPPIINRVDYQSTSLQQSTAPNLKGIRHPDLRAQTVMGIPIWVARRWIYFPHFIVLIAITSTMIPRPHYLWSGPPSQNLLT